MKYTCLLFSFGFLHTMATTKYKEKAFFMILFALKTNSIVFLLQKNSKLNKNEQNWRQGNAECRGRRKQEEKKKATNNKKK